MKSVLSFKTFYRNLSSHPVELSFVDYSNDKSLQPFLILHGLFGQKSNWNSVSKALQRKLPMYRIIAADLRNHGSSPHSKHMNIPTMALDVEHLLKTIDNSSKKTAVICGHSLGGKVAGYLAMTRQNLLDKLIIEDVVPGKNYSGSLNEIPKYVKAMKSIDFSQLPANASISDARKLADQRLLTVVQDVPTRQFLLMNIAQDETLKKFTWKVNLNAIDIDHITKFPGWSGKFEGPTLVIGGSKSPYIKLDKDIDTLRKYFPNMNLVLIDAGHWLHTEKPQDFMDAVVKFLL